MTRERASTEESAPTLPATPSSDETQDSAIDTSGRVLRPRDSDVALVVGDRIGDRYAIRSYLGEGGMGAVYRAYDEAVREDVALKVVRGGVASQAELRDEVRVAQQVTHPNVCRTYDLEDIAGRHLIKMEYIAGDTLAARLAATGPMPIARTIEVARAIADGLAAAHAKGIVHRDLKPGNVMLCGDRVVLMDFGLARRVADIDVQRSGTPAYMSPEQLDGRHVDERSDLFALGCLVYEMLVGKRAFEFEGSMRDYAAARAKQPVPDLRAQRPETPRWLARAAAELMDPDPAVRARGRERLRHGPRRAWILAPTAAVIVAALGAWFALRPRPPWIPEIRDLDRYVGNADQPVLSPDGATLAYAGDPSSSGRWTVFVRPIEGGVPRQVSPASTHCFTSRWTLDGRSLLMGCRIDDAWRIVEQPIAMANPIPYDRGPGRYADDCGDTLIVALDAAHGWELVRRTRDGHDTPILHHPRKVTQVRCGRDGQVAFVDEEATGYRGGDAFVIDRAGKLEPIGHAVDALAFTPDGRSVVLVRNTATGGDPTTSLVEVVIGGGGEHALTPLEQHATNPIISSDGRRLWFHRDLTSDTLSELVGTALVRRSFGTGALDNLISNAQGDIVYAQKARAEGDTILAITVADGTEREVIAGTNPFVARDGTRLWFRDPHDPQVLRVLPLAGGSDRVVARLDRPIDEGVDGPDGEHLSVGRDGELEAWLVPAAGGSPVREGVPGLVIPAPAGGWRAIKAKHPDGRNVIAFVEPGQPLSTVAFERAAMAGRPAWIDDHHFAYCDFNLCHVVDVSDRTDVIRGHAFGSEDDYVVAPETQRWFTTRESAQVTLHELTNFDRRPWKP